MHDIEPVIAGCHVVPCTIAGIASRPTEARLTGSWPQAKFDPQTFSVMTIQNETDIKPAFTACRHSVLQNGGSEAIDKRHARRQAFSAIRAEAVGNAKN